MKVFYEFCFCWLLIGILSAGEFRVSGDGTMKVFYFDRDVALFREIGTDMVMDMEVERFWYTLTKADFAGLHELASLTGDVRQQQLVNNVKALCWFPESGLIAGSGQIEANRPTGHIPVDWPSQYFCYSIAKDTMEVFSDYNELESALKARGVTLKMETPEVFIEKVELKVHKNK